MNLRNRIQLIGNVGADPVVKKFENGQKADFSLATTEFYTKDGKKHEETTWHHCVAWNKNAELIEKNIKKGDEVILSGKINNRIYEDKDGAKRSYSEVLIDSMVFHPKFEKA